MKHAISQRRSFWFNLGWPIVSIGNLLCGYLNYVIWSDGLIGEDLYSSIVDSGLIFVAAAAVAFFGFVFSAAVYMVSFDAWRPGRPRVRLYVLFLSFFVFLAGYIVGTRQVAPDNFVVLGIGAAVCLLSPIAVLKIECLLGNALQKTAAKLHGRGDRGPALPFARAALSLCPGDTRSRSMLALSLSYKDEFEQAKPLLTEAYERGDRNEALLYELARAHRKTGENEAAARLLEELHALKPSQKTLHDLLTLWKATGQVEKLIDYFSTLTPEDKRRWHPQILEMIDATEQPQLLRKYCAYLYTDAVMLSEAAACYTSLVQALPRDAGALRKLIELEEKLGRSHSVIELLETLTALQPNDSQLRRKLVDYYESHGLEDRAWPHIELLVQQELATELEVRRLAERLFMQSRYDDLRALMRRNEMVRNSYYGHYLLAASDYESDNLEQALDEVKKGKSLPSDPDFTSRMVDLEKKVRLRLLDIDLQKLGEEVEKNPQDMDLLKQYTERLVTAGKTEKAVHLLDHLLNTKPETQPFVLSHLQHLIEQSGDQRLLGYMSDVHMREQNWDGMFATYEYMARQSVNPEAVLHEGAAKVLRENPNHAPSLLVMARHAAAHHHHESALDFIDRYRQSGGELPPEILQLEFDLAVQSGQTDRASSSGSTLLELQPGNTRLLVQLSKIDSDFERFDAAIDKVARARQVEPENRELAAIQKEYETQRKRSRMAQIRERVAAKPENFTLFEELGDLHYDFGELNDALVAYQRAAHGTEGKDIAKAKLGYVLAVKAMYAESEEILRETHLAVDQALEVQQKIKALMFSAAELMENEKNDERALTLYKRIFRVDAGYREVVSRIERLQHLDRKKKP